MLQLNHFLITTTKESQKIWTLGYNTVGSVILSNEDLGTGAYTSEVNLIDLINILWAHKAKVISITLIFAIGSVILALSIPNQYKATALLAPAQSETGGLSNALGQLSTFAPFAGVGLGLGQRSESRVAQEIMKSWSFVETFISDNDLAIEIYAAEDWNKNTDEIQINETVYDMQTSTWLLEDSETDELRPPTSWELYEEFSKILSVSEDIKSGLVTVSIEYFSPYKAKTWLDMYIGAINKHMQERQVAKATNNIEYLETQISKTSIAEMREVFYTIIEEQTKNKMVAEASPEYAFVAVSPSMVPEEKSKPRRAQICIIVTLLGGLISSIGVLLRHYSCERKNANL